MVNEFLKDLAKSDAKYDKMEDQYLSQIFAASDEEIESIQALAAERSVEAVDKCKTKEEFEALVGEEL